MSSRGKDRAKEYFKPRSWERIKDEHSARIYWDMETSAAYIDLSDKAARIYTCMKHQMFGVNIEDKPGKKDDQFVFNKELYQNTFKVCTNGEQFTRYCHELVKNGFIEVVESGKCTRTKNVYRFVGKWQNWTPGTDYRPVAMREHDDKLKTKRAQQRKNQSDHFGS